MNNKKLGIILIISPNIDFEIFKSLMEKYGYFAIFIISIIWTMGTIPIPSQSLLSVIHLFNLNPYLVILAYLFGTLIGEFPWYFAGYFASFSAKKRKIDIPYKDKIDKLFDKYGFLTIVIFSATPLPLDALSMLVGYQKYNLIKFCLGVLLGKLISVIITLKIFEFIF